MREIVAHADPVDIDIMKEEESVQGFHRFDREADNETVPTRSRFLSGTPESATGSGDPALRGESGQKREGEVVSIRRR
jgi:hypothetical protein